MKLASGTQRQWSSRWGGHVLTLTLLLLAFTASAAAERRASTLVRGGPDFAAEYVREDVETLASPSFEGRSLGSEGADRAAAFIEKRFRDIGLQPAPGIGYQQQFPVRLQMKVSDSARRNELSLAGPAAMAALTLHKDFLPLPFSGIGQVRNAPLVFAGYAMHAPELDYDDFAGVDVAGKVVIAFRREPQEKNRDSRFAGLEFTRHASFAAKARAVAARGGKALLIISNRLPAEEEAELPAFPASSGPAVLPIPVLMVRPAAIAPFFVEQGLSLSGLVRAIDEQSQPRSKPFADSYRVSLSVRPDATKSEGRNVLGWLPGDPSNGEYVVVGAHYDHVGRGERFSMDNAGSGKLHPGADDNASGMAALMELARVAALRRSAGSPGGRSVLFVAFGGEEHGLFGSAHFLHQQPVPGFRLAGMLNFDMVGRLRENEIFSAGLESVPELRSVAETAAREQSLELRPLPDYPYNMSDHGTFLDAGIPAVLLFTGLHMEYHTPRDTPDRINAPGMLQVLHVASALLDAITDPARPLRFEGGKNPGYERIFREVALPSNPFDFE